MATKRLRPCGSRDGLSRRAISTISFDPGKPERRRKIARLYVAPPPCPVAVGAFVIQAIFILTPLCDMQVLRVFWTMCFVMFISSGVALSRGACQNIMETPAVSETVSVIGLSRGRYRIFRHIRRFVLDQRDCGLDRRYVCPAPVASFTFFWIRRYVAEKAVDENHQVKADI